MLPFFQLVQELYPTALARTFGSEYKSTWLPQIECMAVNIQKYFEGGTTSGYVAAVRVTRDELTCGQNVLSPYVYIGKYEVTQQLWEYVMKYSGTAADGSTMSAYASDVWSYPKNISSSNNEL